MFRAEVMKGWQRLWEKVPNYGDRLTFDIDKWTRTNK
jgi:hypothetical protein